DPASLRARPAGVPPPPGPAAPPPPPPPPRAPRPPPPPPPPRTMWRTRPPCAKAPRWAIRRHDCDARPPWLSPATVCGAHLVELSDLPYPWVTCSACRTRFPTFHHLVPEIGPL
ncbi:hypothetical protein, partial [Nocardia abscessus]|uniref:hypothetical protein n=1 Tax=Nocardia abscessus TaxID=120957 RepID=UPI002457975D